MDRRLRPAGKFARLIDQSPVEAAARPGRKLFAVHKNMHSFGFMIGSDSVAQQYFQKVAKDLQERYQSLETKPRPKEVPIEDVSFLRQELVRKEAELRAVKKSYQALIRVKRDEAETERTPPSTKVDAEVETEATIFPPKRTRPLRYESPMPQITSPEQREESGDLKTHPAFRVERYTRKHPKRYTDNPILGYSTTRGVSPVIDTQLHRRERSFADYGTMVLR